MNRTAAIRAVAAVAILTSCSGTGSDRQVVVSAAASLTSAFADTELAFEARYPEIDVLLNLGGSSALRDQILEGAPVDVFASADTMTMDAVRSAGLIRGETHLFARNELQIVVPLGNPGQLDSLDDFADSSLLIGLCARPVPCGAFARTVLDAAGVEASVDTEEPDVRALLTKVAEGELDVAIVYVTDAAAAAGRVETIDIPGAFNVEVRYPIAVVTTEDDSSDAELFVDFVLSSDGQEILFAHGFSR